jgi:hypothetical protein
MAAIFSGFLLKWSASSVKYPIVPVWLGEGVELELGSVEAGAAELGATDGAALGAADGEADGDGVVLPLHAISENARITQSRIAKVLFIWSLLKY